MSHFLRFSQGVLRAILLLAGLAPAGAVGQSTGANNKASQEKPVASAGYTKKLSALSSPFQSLVLTPGAAGKAGAVFQATPGVELPAVTKTRLEELNAKSIGGGRFSAELDFDFEGFALEQQRRADLAKQGIMIPVFNGRAMVGLEKIQFIDPAVIREAVRLNRPIPVPIPIFHGIPISVDPSRELMITDLSVVEDPTRTFDPCTNSGTPMGAWTFGKLMTDMANGKVDPARMVEDWLKLWTTDQAVNTFNVPNREAGINIHLLSTWKRTSNGELDLSQAPFDCWP